MNWQHSMFRLWIAASPIWIAYAALKAFSLSASGSLGEPLFAFAVVAIVPVVGVLLLGFIVKWLIAGFRR